MINATQLQLQIKIYINQLELKLGDGGNVTSCQKQLIQEELNNFRSHFAILSDLISIYENYGDRPEVPLTSDKQIEVLQLLYKSDDGDYRSKSVYTVSVENIMSLLREYQNVFVKKDGDVEIYDVSSNITIDDLDSFIIHFAIRDTSLSTILGISSIPIRYYNVVANELKSFFPNLDDRQFLIQALSQISTNPTLQFSNELDSIFSSSDPNGALAKLLWTGFHEYYSEKEMARLRDGTFIKMIESLEESNYIKSEDLEIKAEQEIKTERIINRGIANRLRKSEQRNENRREEMRIRGQRRMKRRRIRAMNRNLRNLNYRPENFKTGLVNTSGIKEELRGDQNEFDFTNNFTYDEDYNTTPSYYNTTGLGMDNLGFESEQADDENVDQVRGLTGAESNADQL